MPAPGLRFLLPRNLRFLGSVGMQVLQAILGSRRAKPASAA